MPNSREELRATGPVRTERTSFTDAPERQVAYLEASRRLRVHQSVDSQGVAVALEGELDLETAPELDRHLADIEQIGPTRLLIDLRAVDFVDSRGLAAIVRAQQSAESHGYALVLRRGPRQVQRLFRVAGIEPRLTFDDE